MGQNIDINKDDPEWAFGINLPPNSEQWHCMLYEYLRSADKLHLPFQKYWLRQPKVPHTTGEFLRIRSNPSNRTLIGDLDIAAILFLTPYYPEIPWLKLPTDERIRMMQLMPRREICFDEDVLPEPVYITRAKVEDRTINVELLVRESDRVGTIIPSFRKIVKPLLTGQHFESFLRTNNISGWKKCELSFGLHEKLNICEMLFKKWLRENKFHDAKHPRANTKGPLKRLAVYRLSLFARSRGITLQSVYDAVSGLYEDYTDWSDRVALVEDEIRTMNILLTPLSAGRFSRLKYEDPDALGALMFHLMKRNNFTWSPSDAVMGVSGPTISGNSYL